MRRPFVGSMPGNLLAIPLKRGGWGVVLVAHQHEFGGTPPETIVVYGFDRVFDHVPTFNEAAQFGILDTIHNYYGSDVLCRRGRWKSIGLKPGFRAEDWPRPPEAVLNKDPTTGRFTLRDSDPAEQRIVVGAAGYAASINVPAAGLATPEEYMRLPPFRGLGCTDALEASLDLALRDHTPRDYFRVTEQALAAWRRVLARVKEQGLYPEPCREYSPSLFPPKKRAARRVKKKAARKSPSRSRRRPGG